MQNDLGIVRDGQRLAGGIKDVDYLLETAEKIRYDSSVMPYFNYSLIGILTLARAVLTCADFRKESRGAHFRSDFPETRDGYAKPTIISYEGEKYLAGLEKEDGK